MTYVEQVRADVAARYGVPVIGRVQIIPKGISGLSDAPLTWRELNRIRFENYLRGLRHREQPTQREWRQQSKLTMQARREGHRATPSVRSTSG